MYPDLWGALDAFIIKISSSTSPPATFSGFEFSSILSPQSVNVPFQVTITAKDGKGNVKTDFNGSISLTSNIGSVSPSSVTLTKGTAPFNTKVLNSGFGVYLNAHTGGMYGNSNIFIVSSGMGTDIGNFYGKVKDNRNQNLPGAKVYLDNNNDGIPEYTATTNTNGEYNFTNKPSGIYTIWASYSGTESSKDPIYVPPYNNWNTRELTINLFSSGKTPVLLVPGIMGTSDNESDNIIPKLPEEYAPDAKKLVLHDPRSIDFNPRPGWRTLIKELQNKGYEKNQTIVAGGYDWRMPVEEVVDRYLIPAIDYAKQKTGSSKVNIVAHRTGELVARTYIQSKKYKDRNDIYKLAMVATPNMGSVNPYYIWAGGDPKWADDLNETGKIEPFVNFYWRVVKK